MRTAPAVLIAFLLFSPCNGLRADAWVYEPSLTVDQRIDDNYRVDPVATEAVAVSRLSGEVNLSRRTPGASHDALARVDGLYTRSDIRDAELASNQTVELDSQWTYERVQYGLGLHFKRDRPSQDISVDITEPGSGARDTGADVDQEKSVRRRRFEITPEWRFDLTRRSAIEAGLRYTEVEHGLTDPEDALIERYTFLTTVDNPPDGFDPTIPLDQVTFDDVPVPFVVTDELDDFRELRFDLGWRFRLSPISTFLLRASYSDYRSETEPDERVRIPFENQIPDPDQRFILRNPRRDSLAETVVLRAGIEHRWSPTLLVTGEVGVFRTETDDSDTLRPDDPTALSDAAAQQAASDALVTTEDGWLASFSLARDLDSERYSARVGVDVQPSSVGSPVEAFEFVGDYTRVLNPRLDAYFQLRAYEPDAIDPAGDDEFKRRFFSLEPKIVWRADRNWTAALAYRYRRQRSQTDNESGVSNALLFTLVWSPPSRPPAID